jgi:hypothetical protein
MGLCSRRRFGPCVDEQDAIDDFAAWTGEVWRVLGLFERLGDVVVANADLNPAA